MRASFPSTCTGHLSVTNLCTGVGVENKGFKLLAKMGYKGEGSKPLDVSIKAGKAGLGIDEDRKRAAAAKKDAERLRILQAREDMEVRSEDVDH